MESMSNINDINEYLTKIYFYIHYEDQGPISHNTIRLLQLLEKRGNIGIGDVASYFKISANTASENVKRLVKKKYITKEKCEMDERKVYLRLTDTGKKVLFLNTRLDEDKLAIIFKDMPEEKRKTVLDGMRILSEECEKLFDR